MMLSTSSRFILQSAIRRQQHSRHCPQAAVRFLAAAATSRLSPELIERYGNQITREFEASHLYLAASIWCDSQDFTGMAAFMRAEAEEERAHALQFIDFASKRNIPITLAPIAAPSAQEWDSIEAVWEGALVSEEKNTESLLALADSAASCQDHAVMSFLQPFHMEQVNAEDTLRTIISKVKDKNQTPGLLRQLDLQLEEEAAKP